MGQYLSVPVPAPLDIQAIIKAEKEAKQTKIFLLRNAGLPCCPRRLPQMTALREVDLSSNRIVEIPFEIGELIKLRVLNVSHNLLALLPDSIGTCVLLKVLNASHNTLEKIPDTLGQLLRLERADFTGWF
jgi:Leucine-rich repeat (LRR) protein